MNIQETLLMYRQKFGIDTKAANENVDPFDRVANKQPLGGAEEEETDPFLHQGIEDVTIAPKEGYSDRLTAFSEEADNDPILSKDRSGLHTKILNLRDLVMNPNHPIEMEQAMEMLNGMLTPLEQQELMEQR